MKPLYALAFSAAVLTSWSAVAETTVTTTSTSCRGTICTETRTVSNGSEPANQKQMSIVEERLYREEKEARIRRAVFKIKLDDEKKARTVTIKAGNKSGYNRGEEATMIEDWLRARGFVLTQETAQDAQVDSTLADA